jgi:hypothetical protein
MQAQTPSNVQIATAGKEYNYMKIMLVSDTPFRFGDNKYYLHIGQHVFSKYKQFNKEGSSGGITFYIEENEFNQLMEGAIFWLSYGNVLHDKAKEEEIKKAANDMPGIISFLGNFSKNIFSE